MEWLWILLLAPLVTGVAAWQAKTRYCAWIQLGGATVMLISGLAVVCRVMTGTPITGFDQTIYVDVLGAFNIGLVVFVGFTACLYSLGHMKHELTEGSISPRQFHHYYFLLHLFLFAMLASSVVNNIGLMWVGIELTTIVSALLVGLYNKETALEAAWKYLIMGSVGLSFALLGIIFIYLSGSYVFGDNPLALHWTVLLQMAKWLNPQWMLTGFVFVLIGFGAKAGVAPMHFWLPDAYSQSPAPVSAVLSGALLNTVLYGILRIYIIANAVLPGQVAQYLIYFGIFSIAVSVPFLLVQRDLKRMLAFSSVEHIGIILLGIGIGGPLGSFGALLHMFNHSMVKSLLFMAAGNIQQKYHTKQIERIGGVLSSMPVTGKVFLLAVLALAGAPPFSLFISEITIMMAGFNRGHIGITVLFLFMVVLIFAGMIYYTVKMVFGAAPAGMQSKEIGGWSTVALFLPLIAVAVFGLYVPPWLSDAIHKVAVVLQGVY